jgi:ATP-dependent Clp protease adaptor protein ClpS
MVPIDSIWSSNQKHKEEELLVLDAVSENSKLIVYNDEFNTFDWVIECFMDILNHNEVQAEQLSYMIHFNGKANVKSGSKKVLAPFKQALIDRGLSAVIED